jgi:hypothetical protein
MAAGERQRVAIGELKETLLSYLLRASAGERFVANYRRESHGSLHELAKQVVGNARPSAAIVSLKDLGLLEVIEYLERVVDDAERDPDLHTALEEDGGLSIDALGAAIKTFRALTTGEPAGGYRSNVDRILDRATRRARDSKLKRAYEEAGLQVTWPTGKPRKRSAPLPYDPGDELISEQIVRERR